MIPYILADSPNICTREAFEESRRIMDGEKWNTFVLQLSFIGWSMLSSLTCGLLSVFYLAPYQCYTYAALYHELSGKNYPVVENGFSEALKNES